MVAAFSISSNRTFRSAVFDGRKCRYGSILLKKVWHDRRTVIPSLERLAAQVCHDGRQTGDQSQLSSLFNLERRIPVGKLLCGSIGGDRILASFATSWRPYSDIGRPSIDPELMIRMLIIGYCYGIRSERRLCEEVDLHLAYRWFCRLDLDDQVPDHSTFSVNRHGRFRDSDILRQVFEAVVRACMDAGLVKGEGFAVDASVLKPTPAAITARCPARSTGRCRSGRPAPPPSSWPGSMMKIRMPTTNHRS